MNSIIAGYTAEPKTPDERIVYYEKLVSVPNADGLEFGWTGPEATATLFDVLDLLPESWSVTLNDITGTFRSSVQNPLAGLASPDPDGRAAAVRFAAELATAVRTVNDRLGRKAVLAVELHSAPGFANRVRQPDADAFARSLAEVAEFDWDSAAVLVEHCDAFVDGQTPAKGFLRLEDEIRAVAAVEGAGLGVSLNWGRSLIELRDADRVVEHVQEALVSGWLRAVTFSGTAGVDNVYGVGWADSHLPFADTEDAQFAAPESQLTRARVRQALDALDGWEPLFLACKTQWLLDHLDPVERAASVLANYATFLNVRAGATGTA